MKKILRSLRNKNNYSQSAEATNLENASLISKKQTCLPDEVYNQYLNGEELRVFREASLATIREILKNDEW